MSVAAQMLESASTEAGYNRDDLAACIEACFVCTQACTACADSCLGADMVAEMRRCITTDLNCADLCAATGRILSRQTEYDPALTTAALTACRDACGICAAECEGHAQMMKCCKVCAEACRRCEKACAKLLDA